MRVRYKKPESKSGKFTVHIPEEIVEDIAVICRIKDITITRYVNDTLQKALEIDFTKLREVSKHE